MTYSLKKHLSMEDNQLDFKASLNKTTDDDIELDTDLDDFTSISETLQADLEHYCFSDEAAEEVALALESIENAIKLRTITDNSPNTKIAKSIALESFSRSIGLKERNIEYSEESLKSFLKSAYDAFVKFIKFIRDKIVNAWRWLLKGIKKLTNNLDRQEKAATDKAKEVEKKLKEINSLEDLQKYKDEDFKFSLNEEFKPKDDSKLMSVYAEYVQLVQKNFKAGVIGPEGIIKADDYSTDDNSAAAYVCQSLVLSLDTIGSLLDGLEDNLGNILALKNDATSTDIHFNSFKWSKRTSIVKPCFFSTDVPNITTSKLSTFVYFDERADISISDNSLDQIFDKLLKAMDSSDTDKPINGDNADLSHYFFSEGVGTFISDLLIQTHIHTRYVKDVAEEVRKNENIINHYNEFIKTIDEIQIGVINSDDKTFKNRLIVKYLKLSRVVVSDMTKLFNLLINNSSAAINYAMKWLHLSNKFIEGYSEIIDEKYGNSESDNKK